MGENGFDEHKLAILYRLDALEESLQQARRDDATARDNAAQERADVKTAIAVLQTQIKVWSVVGGTVSGGLISVIVGLVLYYLTKAQ